MGAVEVLADSEAWLGGRLLAADTSLAHAVGHLPQNYLESGNVCRVEIPRVVVIFNGRLAVANPRFARNGPRSQLASRALTNI